MRQNGDPDFSSLFSFPFKIDQTFLKYYVLKMEKRLGLMKNTLVSAPLNDYNTIY